MLTVTLIGFNGEECKMINKGIPIMLSLSWLTLPHWGAAMPEELERVKHDLASYTTLEEQTTYFKGLDSSRQTALLQKLEIEGQMNNGKMF
ncbi:MAG: hypothetical protein Q8Q56_02100 [Alphaproteobacteria bacterium]|nr:hypothetical protein [Alphaproteobacteria bacterium]